MLLTLTSTTAPARDLGYLLRKHPDRLQSFDLPFGKAHVFYPEADQERCTAAMLLDVDPVGLVRGRATATEGGGLVDAYVNDRPYAASSFLSVAIARVLGAALGGRSDNEELAAREMRLSATVSPVRGSTDDLPVRLFAPLGYDVAVAPVTESDGTVSKTKQADHHTLAHSMQKLAHQGVLLKSRLGRLVRYRLNPHFPAAHELRAFLLEFSQSFPEYGASVAALEFNRTPRARQLRTSTTASSTPVPAIDPKVPPQ